MVWVFLFFVLFFCLFFVFVCFDFVLFLFLFLVLCFNFLFVSCFMFYFFVSFLFCFMFLFVLWKNLSWESPCICDNRAMTSYCDFNREYFILQQFESGECRWLTIISVFICNNSTFSKTLFLEYNLLFFLNQSHKDITHWKLVSKALLLFGNQCLVRDSKLNKKFKRNNHFI